MSTSSFVPRKKSHRLPAVVNTSVALLALLAIIPLTLRASQGSPPVIAEFARQPQHPILQAPQEQGTTVGHGQPGGEVTLASPSPSPPAAGLPAGAIVRQCVAGSQIEDPQSPPCVPYWSGNNGGST